MSSQLRNTPQTRVEFSAKRKWSRPLNKCSSLGWPARRNISIDCSVGVTESDALISYLQMLGTQVDFKLYDNKANIR